jgi:hypothetical protein
MNILSKYGRRSPVARSFCQDRTGMTAGVREQLMLTRWKQPCVIWEASKLCASCSIGEAAICGPHAANTAAVLPARLMRLMWLWSAKRIKASYLCDAVIMLRLGQIRKVLLTIY